MMQTLAYASPLVGLVALGFAFMKSNKVNGADAGTDRMKEIANDIREGAHTSPWQYARSNTIPARASLSIFGVRQT